MLPTNAAERLTLTETLFSELIALAEPERTSMLEARCAGDTALREELRALLEACEAEEAHRCTLLVDPSAQSGARVRIGPYLIDRLLGRGGMGAVYLAQRADGHFDQQVAIKLVDLPLATEFFRERFVAERQILASLSHPYIAKLLDGGVSEHGDPYLAMEFIEGERITDFCQSRSLTLRERLVLFLKVCQAVQYAHQHLVVHRDLKPDNILVDIAGNPHLLDFGTAKLLSASSNDFAQDLTRPGFQLFTPRYASPEQVLGQPNSIASDIYALGVLLHVLLTGEPPYELADFSTEEMIRVICHEPPQRPSSIDASLDADLDNIVGKALRKEPQARYATVDQFSADVQAFLEHRPVQARRGSLRYHSVKFVRRNRIALAVAALLLLTLLAGIGGVVWQARIANLQRVRAEARSADLRELSNSLLSELDEALKDIPGSTGAQKLLVTRVLEHLDRMARDAKGDRQTTLDLIGAYTRLGDVQSNRYYQNVGDTPGALASFGKALGLAEPLVAKYPKDREVLRAYAAALQARGEVLSDGGDPQASEASLLAAVHVYDQVVALPDVTPPLIFEAAIAYEILGNESGEDSGLGDVAAAAAAYRRALDMDGLALRMDPNYMAVRRGLPIMHLHLGNLILETDPANALSEFQTALQLSDAFPAEQRQKRKQVRTRAQLLYKIAEAHAELGEYSLAFPLFDQSLIVFRQLSAADASDTGALADLYRILYYRANAYRYAADPLLADAAGAAPQVRRKRLQIAASSLEECSATIRRILQLAPSHDPWNATLAEVLLQLDTVHKALGQPSLSAVEAAELLAQLRKAAEGPHAAAGDISTAVNALLSIQPVAFRNPKLAVALAERGVTLTHGREAEYLLLLAQAQHANGQIREAGSSAQQGLDLLPAVVPQQPQSRLRKLLESEVPPA